jgi:hypothetical protein
MGSVKYIPTEERGRVMSGPTTAMAVMGISASAVACVGLCVSAALHMFGGFSRAPILGEAISGTPEARHPGTTANPIWLTVWNILLPAVILAITLVVFRSWRNRENSNRQ